MYVTRNKRLIFFGLILSFYHLFNDCQKCYLAIANKIPRSRDNIFSQSGIFFYDRPVGKWNKTLLCYIGLPYIISLYKQRTIGFVFHFSPLNGLLYFWIFEKVPYCHSTNYPTMKKMGHILSYSFGLLEFILILSTLAQIVRHNL